MRLENDNNAFCNIFFIRESNDIQNHFINLEKATKIVMM